MAEDGVIAAADEAERFEKEKRWSLLTVLAWIATGDMASARRAAGPGETIQGVDISMAVTSAMDGSGRAYRTVSEAWTQELAPAISDGKISGSGSIVTFGAAHERREVGLTFPSTSKPREADHLELAQRGHEVALAPKGFLLGQAASVTEWRDLLFATGDILRLWPAPTAAVLPPGTSSFPPPDYRYLSDAFIDFIRFKEQHGPVSSEDAEREMFEAIKADAIRVFFEDERGSIRLLPASDIAEASTRPAFMSIFGARPLCQLQGNPLAPANGSRALVHERSFHDWTYWVRMSPAAQARANADTKERERLKLIAAADWMPPANFMLADLETACGGHRPWLSQVVNFMAFGTPGATPRVEEVSDAAAIVAHQALVAAHQAPVERLLFESGRRGENRFVGILKGERDDRQIPPTVFDHPNLYWPDNTIRRAIEHLTAEEYEEACKNPTPDWTQVRLDWEPLKPWLIARGARIAADESNGRKEAIDNRLSRGEIGPADAERERREAGVRPGVQQPNRGDFNPAREVQWTISMAVLWMAHGQMESVVEGMEDFAVNCWYARSKADGTYYGPDDIDQLGHDAVAAGYTIQWLRRDDLNRLLYFRPNSSLYREVFENLRREIIERQIKTYGIRDATRDVIEIEPYKWSHLWAWGVGEAGFYLAADEKSSERFFDVWIRREDVPGLADHKSLDATRAGTETRRQPVTATSSIQPSPPPISDSELRAALAKFKASGEPFNRIAARAWFKRQYGDRVTVRRIDRAIRAADVKKRGRGRPKELAQRG